MPLTSPSIDFYGGDRKGQNLFGNSLVALDCETGERRWHFQTIHHDLWDWDLPSQPVLADVVRDGKSVPAVVQVAKTGFIFVLDRLTGEPLFPVEERPVPPSPIPGEDLSMAEVGLGGKLVEHFLTKVIYASDALGQHGVDDQWARIDAAVREIPPGSGGLLFLPWLNGAQAPKQSETMRGGFLGVTLDTTRAHMLRAILEGIAYHLRWMLPGAEAFSKQSFESLYFSGGGATSDAWSQIMADVTGRPILQLADARQANTRGAAFLVFRRMGLVTDADVDSFCPVKRRYEPSPEARKTYDHLFEQFQLAYEQTEPIYDALHEH